MPVQHGWSAKLEFVACSPSRDHRVVITIDDSGLTPIDPSAHLSGLAGVSANETLLAPLIAYARGHATGNPRHFQHAFRATAHIEGVRDGAFVSWSLAEYCALFTSAPAADERARRRTLTGLQEAGTVAYAAMLLEHGPDIFTDLFLLVEEAGSWRIANKLYDRRPTDPEKTRRI